MGLIDSTSISGLGSLLGFGKSIIAKMTDRLFPYIKGFIKSSDVYSVTMKIARNGADLKWILKKEVNGIVEVVASNKNTGRLHDGDLYKLIQNPNKQQNRFEFVLKALLFLLLSGEVFQKKIISEAFKGEVLAVDLLNPQLTDINVIKTGTIYVPKNYTYGGSQNIIPVDDVEHLKYVNPTIYGEQSLRGLSPLVSGSLTLTGLTNNQEANATILENQGAAGILSNESEVPLTGPEQEQQQSVLDKLIAGVRNFGKVIQSSAKVKFTRLGLDAAQLKIIESKIMMFRDLCAIYDTKSILFNDPVNASFKNLVVAEKSHYLCAVIPNTKLIIQMFTDGVVSEFNKTDFPNGNGRYFIEIDKSSIEVLQADLKAEAQKDKIRMDGVKVILEMPISSIAKINLLVDEYGYTEESAGIIVNPTGTANPQLEILQSLSPLLANKLIEKLSEEEVRALLGL